MIIFSKLGEGDPYFILFVIIWARKKNTFYIGRKLQDLPWGKGEQ